MDKRKSLRLKPRESLDQDKRADSATGGNSVRSRGRNRVRTGDTCLFSVSEDVASAASEATAAVQPPRLKLQLKTHGGEAAAAAQPGKPTELPPHEAPSAEPAASSTPPTAGPVTADPSLSTRLPTAAVAADKPSSPGDLFVSRKKVESPAPESPPRAEPAIEREGDADREKPLSRGEKEALANQQTMAMPRVKPVPKATRLGVSRRPAPVPPPSDESGSALPPSQEGQGSGSIPESAAVDSSRKDRDETASRSDKSADQGGKARFVRRSRRRRDSPSEQAEPGEERSQSAARHVQPRPAALPESARKAMREDDEKKEKARESAAARDNSWLTDADTAPAQYLGGGLALLMAWLALILATMPLWRRVGTVHDLLLPAPMIILGFAVLLSILLLIRQLASRILAGILLAAALLAGGGLLAFERWPHSVQVMMVEYEVLDVLAPFELLAVALVLMLAGFVLNTGVGAWRWSMILLLLVTAAGLPWFSSSLPGLRAPMIYPAGFAPAELEGWSQFERQGDEVVWRSEEDGLHCRVRFYPEDEGKIAGVEDFRVLLEARWREAGFGPVSVIPVVDKPHQQRYVAFAGGGRAVAALALDSPHRAGFYLLIFEVENYASRQALINRIMQAVE